jgi:hypothetical protein
LLEVFDPYGLYLDRTDLFFKNPFALLSLFCELENIFWLVKSYFARLNNVALLANKQTYKNEYLFSRPTGILN